MAYPDGTARMEKVHQQHPVLEIDYWRANGSGPWYFEDPITGAVTRAGSDKKLRKALSKRNFWWLETDEDVTVTCNRDGSKSYEYKGLTNPVEITQLLELESKQVEIEANKPVSKWKAGALAAMSLLGNSMGLQALVKNSVPTVEPESPKPAHLNPGLLQDGSDATGHDVVGVWGRGSGRGERHLSTLVLKEKQYRV